MFGLALLVILLIRADVAAMLHTIALAGWRILWLVPYRLLFFLLYAIGWRWLLAPYDTDGRVSFAYLYWITTVREGIDRLLPVASVGGSVAGVRLLRWKNIAAAQAGASVIVEILVTLAVVYAFTALGLMSLFAQTGGGAQYHRVVVAFLCTLPAPVICALLLRYGSVFRNLQRFLAPLVGQSVQAEGAEALDHELRATLRRKGAWLGAGALQLLAMILASFEVWYVLRLCQHPVSAGSALILESMTTALRHLAFIVPAGIGVQEAGLVLFGGVLGISGELAVAVSMAKRVREVVCGLPPLISWQWMEVKRLSGRSSPSA